MTITNKEWMITLPSLTALTVFFVVPALIIFAYAFRTEGTFAGEEPGWSLHAIRSLSDVNYYFLIARTFLISGLATIGCLLLAIPVGYQLAVISKRAAKALIILFVLPFWTSFLIRIFAWKILLHPEGYIKQILVFLHLADPHSTLLYNQTAVLLVMIYTYIPFAIFPIYAAASKFNFQLIEAAMDLGASQTKSFFKVFIPGVSKGIWTGALMVFIATIGAYVIPDLIGGVNSEMIGNKIAGRIFVDQDLPQASALSLLLVAIVLLPLMITTFISSFRPKRIEAEARNKE